MARKLATIRKIADVQPIEGADAIEVATVDGWKVVVKRGEFSVGDLVLYLEIDSWVPHELAPFLSKGKEPREYNGVAGERLRTVKLRGQISQGLLLKPEDLVFVVEVKTVAPKYLLKTMGWNQEGTDLTEQLGVQKWEKPLPAQMQGKAKGTFPTHLIPKTDQERIQNCFRDVQAMSAYTFEKTMKLDGSSCTIFKHEGELRVCSRNMELKISEENADNVFVKMALKQANSVLEGHAFQGEVMGPGIQGNREGLKDHEFFVFDVWDIKEQRYLLPNERRELIQDINGVVTMPPFSHVPVLEEEATVPESVEAALADAEGQSINHKIREGVVYKCNEDPSFSFKAISNKFLLKGGD